MWILQHLDNSRNETIMWHLDIGNFRGWEEKKIRKAEFLPEGYIGSSAEVKNWTKEYILPCPFREHSVEEF